MAVVDQPQIPTGNTMRVNTPMVTQPVLANERMMRVDYSPGMNAVTAPRLPSDPGRGLVAGAAAMTQGLEHVSNFLTGVAEEVGKAKTISQTDDAENSMTSMAGDFDAWKQNAPPDSWRQEWDTRFSALQKDTLSDDGLTPMAKEAITSKFAHFNVLGVNGINRDYAKDAFGKAAASTDTILNGIAQQGKPGQVDNYIKQNPERAIYLHPERVEELKRFETDNYTQNWILNNYMDAPDTLRNKASFPEQNWSDWQRNQIVARAENVKSQQTAWNVNHAVEGMSKDANDPSAVRTDEQLAMYKPVTTPQQFAGLQDILHSSSPVNTDKQWNDMNSEILRINDKMPKDTQEKAIADTQTDIALNFKGPRKDMMLKILEDHVKDMGSPVTDAFREIDQGREQLIKSGAMGNIWGPKVNAKGEALANDKTTYPIPKEVSTSHFYNPWTWGSTRPGTAADAVKTTALEPAVTENPEKNMNAQGNWRNANEALRAWVKQQTNLGKPPDHDAIIKQWNSITGATTTAGAASSILSGLGPVGFMDLTGVSAADAAETFSAEMAKKKK